MTTGLRPSLALSLVLACLGTALPAAEPVANPAEIITLPKFEVKGKIICSYGIGVVAVTSKKTGNITRLYVDEVQPGSPAARLGLQRGDEILSLNGIRIADLKGGTKPGSDLFDLLVNQPVGRMIDVEVTIRVVKKIVLTATP